MSSATLNAKLRRSTKTEGKKAKGMVGFVGFVSFLACIITLAVSPARWKTFKRMIMTLLGADVVIFVIGALAARILDPRFDVWYLTGELMVCCGILAAAIAGMFQVWAIKNQ